MQLLYFSILFFNKLFQIFNKFCKKEDFKTEIKVFFIYDKKDLFHIHKDV